MKFTICGVVSTALCLFALSAIAQTPAPQGYLSAVGSPPSSVNIPIENGFINITNGNLHMEFPLATHQQRGALQLNERLVYDSRIWMIGHYTNYYWWPTNVPNSSAGWRFVTGAEAGSIQSTYNEDSTTTCADINSPGGVSGQVTTFGLSFSWTDPSGTVHPFGSGWYYNTGSTGGCGGSPVQQSISGYSTDASGYLIELSGLNNGPPNIVVQDGSGNQVYPQVIDRYGNEWSFDSSNNLVDDLNRTPVIATTSGNVTTYDVLSPNGTISNNGTRVRYTVTTAPISVSTQFSENPVVEWSGTLNPVQSIQLPNGSSYKFTYDGYGEPTSVTLPTGGVITYGWSNYLDSYQNQNRWLTSRTVGSNPAMTFTPSVISQCASNGTGCQEQMRLHKPSGDETVYQLTLNNGAWNTNTTVYNGSASGGTPLMNTVNTYDFSHGCSTCIYGVEYITQSSSVTTLSNTGLQSQTQYVYNNPETGKVNAVKQWDYFTGTASSIPTQETDYTYDPLSGLNAGFDLQQVTVLDSNGNQAAQTTYGYTKNAVATSGMPQHGTQNAGGPYLQTVSHWISTGGSSTTTYTMDDTGQVRSIVDPDSHPVTNFTYQCSGALPYQVTNALSQTTTYGYDCNSGQITKVQDPNDLAAGRSGTTYSYESGAGRLQAVNYPDGGQTSYSYPSTTEVDTSVLASPNPAVSSQDVVDSFGRKYQHVQAGISSETTYDVNGRVDCVTNPHFTASSSSTDGTTCVTTYDGLDRPKVQTGTDGSTQSWSYAGNVTTSIDEAGHSWKRTSDALGRLISVIEPTGASTNYVYDALNNLHTVSQTGVSGDTARTRSFVYDSLSRLTSSTNPETGTIGYGYDANGNLTSKTDARGITTTYGYDALNRLTYKHYSDGTLPAAFGYDGKDESGGAVSTPVSNAIGRVSHTSNQTNAAANYSYDSMGRLNHEYYCVPSNCSYGIQVGATYDLAGNTSSLIYPDGRVISQNMDAAGRIASVNYASWNGNAHSGAYINASAAGSYDPAGHLVSATFGNAIGLAASYDKRERVDMLAYGTAAQLLWGKQYQWSANSNLQMITDALTGTQRQFGYDNLNRITSAEDIVGSSQGANTTPFATGSGDTVVGSSSGATPTPSWTDPDDSNILLNPDVPGSTGWEVASSNITTGVLAPDGTATAASFTASSGSTDSYLGAIAAQSSLYDGETMTGSVWLRAPNGTQNVNLYLVEDGTAGYSIPASKSVTVTTTWQQFQLSGKFQYGHTTLIFQIGGAGSVQSGQTISVWGSKLEDTGTSGPTITNFVRYSQRLTASTWGVQAGVAVDNAATAPDGTNTAATVTANSGSSDSWIVDNVPNPAPFSGVPITGSVWLRAPGGPQNISITLIEVGANGYSAFGGGTVSLTTGWQRFQMTGTTQSTLTVLQLQIGGAGTFTNGQSVQVWGAQMELASTAGPYVATGANPESIGTNMTNLLPYSQQPNGPSWSNPGIQGTANAVTAPDGSMTGYQATAASGQTDAYFTNNVQNPALYDSATVTGSIFLRIPSGSLSINIYLAGENASGRTYLGSKAVQLTTAWQRFTLTGQLPNGLTRVFMQIAGAGSFTSGQTFDLWGAQLEEASTAGPYVMTSALPVTTGQELTNLLPNSQQLNGPSWGIANGSLSLNSATAPDGTTTAATLTASASSPDTFAIDNAPNPSLYDEQTVTGSVYLRVASGTLNTFLFLDNSGVSGSTAPNQPITLTTTWQRFSITATNQNGLTQLGLQIGGAGSITNGKSFQVWGPQLVVGSAAAPYIPTPAVGGTTSVVTNQSATLLQNGLDQAYSYDSFGNILENGSFNSNYTAQNRMSGFAYDAAGNLLSNGLTTMTWDAESKLISAGGATYIYDAEGNRVEKQGVGVTDTIYFGGRPLARYSAGGWTDLIYGPNGLLGEVQGTEGADTSYRFLDHLGTEVGTINSNKILINPLDYTPFGQIFSGSTNDPYLFTGLERDMESNLDHAMFRQYASTMGRWMSPDPYNGSMDFGNPQSLNRYSYVGNNPLGYTDPSGLYSLPPGNNCTICNIFDDIFSDLGSLFGGGGHSFHGSTTPRPSIKATGSYGAIQPQGDDTFTMNVSYLVPSSGVGANDLAATGAIISSLSRIMITTDNALHAPPLKVSSGVCSIYGNEPYLGAGLQCVCNSAGDSAWSQDTRGCLAADQKEGIPEFIGHGTCYTGSTIRTQNVPVTTLVGAYLSCKRW